MSQRNVLILLGALVVLVALVLVGQRSRSPASGSGALFVPALAAALNDVERVTVTKAGNETIVALERKPDGWVATNKSGYPADVSKLRQGLRALAEAKILEQKTANPELYSHLGVEDVGGDKATGLAITLTAKGKELPTLILGNAEGAKFRYARRMGDAPSYLIDRNPEFPRGVGQWLDARIVDVRSDRIAQVTITQTDGQVVRISKPNKDAQNFDVADVPKGRELLYPGVANVIGNSLRELNLEDVEAATASPPPTKPTVIEFRTFDGLVVRVEGEKRNDAGWITLKASVDAEQAARAAAAAPAPASDAAKPAAPAAPAAPADPTAEAASINAKVGPWRYKIATFQYDQMTRRLADLLKPPAEVPKAR